MQMEGRIAHLPCVSIHQTAIWERSRETRMDIQTGIAAAAKAGYASAGPFEKAVFSSRNYLLF